MDLAAWPPPDAILANRANFAVNTRPSQSRDEGDTWSMSTSAAALKKSPLARVKEEFGGKDKLVDKIVGVLDTGDESKDELRKRLLGVVEHQADSAVLRRDADQAGRWPRQAGRRPPPSALNRGKDKDYVTKLGELSNGRLLDILSAAEGRQRRQRQGQGQGRRQRGASRP